MKVGHGFVDAAYLEFPLTTWCKHILLDEERIERGREHEQSLLTTW